MTPVKGVPQEGNIEATLSDDTLPQAWSPSTCHYSRHALSTLCWLYDYILIGSNARSVCEH